MKNSKIILFLILIVVIIILGVIILDSKKQEKPIPVTTNISSTTTPEITTTSTSIWKTIQMKSTGIAPILYPEKLPSGLQTQKIIRSGSDNFLVEYTGSNKKIDLLVDMISPGEIDAKGSQTQITIRGQKGTLQLQNAAKPSEFIWLWWEEPGSWKLGGTTRNKIFYMVTGSGFTPQEIENFAETLKPLK